MKSKAQLKKEAKSVRTATTTAALQERLQTVLDGIIDSLGEGTTIINEGGGGGSAGGLKINRDLTKEEYMALKEAGATDPNTLYLIKKDVQEPTE